MTTTEKRHRLLLPVTAILMFFLGFESAALQLALLQMRHHFALSTAQMGLLSSAQYAAIFIMTPLFGMVADRLGKKNLVITGLSIFVGGCLLTGLAPGMGLLLCGIFTVGTGYSVTEALTTAALADLYPEKAARYMNLTQSTFCAGAVIAPLLARFLTQTFALSWRAPFFICAVGTAVCLPFLLATPFAAQPSKITSEETSKKIAPTHWFTLALALLIGAILTYGTTETGTGSYIDSIFNALIEAPHLGAVALSAYWLAMMPSRILFGLLRLKPAPLLMLCTFGSAASLVGLALARSSFWGLLFSVLIGFFLGPCWALLLSLGVRQAPRHSGTIVSLMAAASGLGGAIMPLAAGAVADSFGLQTAIFCIAAFAALGGLLQVLFSFYTKPKK